MNSDSPSSYRSSVTEWLDSVKQGSDAAARKIWERYVEQLVTEANQRLLRQPRGAADGEDIVQEAFASFFRGVQEGRFSQLHDRDDLWQLLIVLAGRRANDHLRHELAERRGAGHVRSGAAMERAGNTTVANPFDAFPSPTATPESAEDLLRLIQIGFPELASYDLQHIALDRAANYSDAEIAARRGISLRGVQRKLQLIRSILTRAAERARVE